VGLGRRELAGDEAAYIYDIEVEEAVELPHRLGSLPASTEQPDS
jgi:hypothetical protein